MKDSWWIVIGLAVLASLSIWLWPVSLRLSSDGLGAVMQVLGSLFLVALIMERALDVALTTTRAADGEDIDREIRRLKSDIAAIDQLAATARKSKQSDRDRHQQDLDEQLKKRDKRSDETRRIAMWASLVVGVLVSAAGFRALASLLDPGSLSELNPFQASSLHIIDVLLTGGLLAGGSDGIHKLMDAYRNFFEGKSKKAKGHV